MLAVLFDVFLLEALLMHGSVEAETLGRTHDEQMPACDSTGYLTKTCDLSYACTTGSSARGMDTAGYSCSAIMSGQIRQEVRGSCRSGEA